MRLTSLTLLLIMSACSFDSFGVDRDAGGAVSDAIEMPIIDAGEPLADAPIATIDAMPPPPPVDGAPIDAGVDPICPDFCSTCDGLGTTCFIDCSGTKCSAGIAIDCPVGMTCQIDCAGTGACNSGAVSCNGDCEIDCVGLGACENGQVSCTGLSCAIVCSGTDTCDHAVRCNAALCKVTCTGSGACEDLGVCCGGFDCGNACQSSGGGNCNCP